jgi:hypothetical protein
MEIGGTPVIRRRPDNIGRTTLLVATRRVMEPLLLGVFPIAFAVLMMRAVDQIGVLGFDFYGTIWQPGREILSGH